MRAYLISIGDELLFGQTINTNVAFIGNLISEINISLIKSTVIGDDTKAILDELELASARADLIICTGGLGPTRDDITRNAFVQYFKTELVYNAEVVEDIKSMLKRRGRELNSTHEDQALVPKIAVVIRNENGTAPGYWIEKDNRIFIAMPGVPYEMKAMMTNHVIPKLIDRNVNTKEFLKKVTLQTTGLPESVLAERLGDIDELLDGAQLAFLPNQYGVRLRVTVNSDDEEKANNHLLEIEQKIRNKIGRFIYGRGDENLEEVVGRLLKERVLRISVAESCTGGGLADRITNINGSSSYFERGVVTYSNAAKVELLNVDEDVMIEKGAVSQEVAMQMAEGIKATSGVDIGISLTGIMGPTGGVADKPVGTVFIGYCDDKVCTAKRFQFGEDRILNKNRATQAALEMVRRSLLGIAFEE
ncbi:MAG: competence/damage-inducible protein A [Ignavibacteriaceae bacterium]|nr:competence/damage-inducible protein A [Ignavibacterium sp.]MCC6254676.1 competence/damage-inducible protein A [Ignavibacteriaceae bacterium]HMN24969.1 competence/damage-inducible protein A [Ignavibacteriaceae bacterium]HRN27518.1 competence/damage-inducible protein A [Ignavibacteriaceae bacterium]HRP93436.1 competence/damage-inducible protein A [Ignavibacteriaceae bacterium]